MLHIPNTIGAVALLLFWPETAVVVTSATCGRGPGAN
jgi:hypothetical protein